MAHVVEFRCDLDEKPKRGDGPARPGVLVADYGFGDGFGLGEWCGAEGGCGEVLEGLYAALVGVLVQCEEVVPDERTQKSKLICVLRKFSCVVPQSCHKHVSIHVSGSSRPLSSHSGNWDVSIETP